MRKTSLYLPAPDVARLRELADRLGVTQAEVMRQALRAFEEQSVPKRDFALLALEGVRSRDGRSAADIPEAQLLEGFGA